MPNILKMGTIPEPKPPWWETTTLTCPHCDTAFMLDASDLTTYGGWTERQERTPGGLHTVEGKCPVCDAPLLIDVRPNANTADSKYRYENAEANRIARHLANYQGGEGSGDDTT